MLAKGHGGAATFYETFWEKNGCEHKFSASNFVFFFFFFFSVNEPCRHYWSCLQTMLCHLTERNDEKCQRRIERNNLLMAKTELWHVLYLVPNYLSCFIILMYWTVLIDSRGYIFTFVIEDRGNLLMRCYSVRCVLSLIGRVSTEASTFSCLCWRQRAGRCQTYS